LKVGCFFTEEFNEVYFKPADKMLNELYEKGLLDKTKFFDENLEFDYYELWHHEERRARFGAAMMPPDYTRWHGFYECKKRYNRFLDFFLNLNPLPHARCSVR
jgi:hydroxylamine dehydrogenase